MANFRRRMIKLVGLFAVAALTAVLALVVAPADALSALRRLDEKGTTAARIQTKTYAFAEAGGKAMEYTLYVPSTYDKAKRWPLIVALHGLHSNPQQIMRYPGLTDLAEKHGYIVVAPMGYNPRGWYGARIVMGARKDDPANLSELSEKDVLNVLDIVRKEYAVDPDRIYLLGHSMGGGGAFHLAAKYPDAWAALAPIAPAPSVGPGEAAKFRHVPVILVQGAKDNMVPVAWVRPWAAEMKKLGMTHEYLEYPEGDHVRVAFTAMPKIFEFFEKYKRGGGQTKKDAK